MTDNEIIKALRFCSDPDTCSCDCSFYVEGENVHECTTKLSVAALDLINRQQAEIERLQGAVQEWVDGKCLSQKHLLKIGKLQNEIEQVKYEAIKEFAEKLKKKQRRMRELYEWHDVVDIDDIDSLVKEMVGESDDR